MNILVIGANGNAGRRIVEKALKAGRCCPSRRCH